MSDYTYTLPGMLSGVPLKEYVPLSLLTSFRIGGPARFVAQPENEEQLLKVLAVCHTTGCPYRVLGNGSNTLAPDAGYNGLILLIDKPFSPLRFDHCRLICSAGETLSSAAKTSVAHGFRGMEGLEGIPGSVGGACAMNAGAYGYEIKQILRSVHFWRNGEVFETAVSDADLSYRKSAFSAPDTILISAVFELQPDDGFSEERMLAFGARRKEKQPLELPSAGSAFKRPEGNFAGTLIENAGLKGMRCGGAAVSEKHAGFIVNLGGATERDVRTLIEAVRQRVYEASGIMLERELKYWNEVG